MSVDTSIALEAKERTEFGKNASRRLRRDGFIPVTIYGGSQEAASGSIGKRELGAFLRAHGRHTIFTLNASGASSPVKIAAMQLDPVKGSIIHLDLMRISLTEKSEFDVAIKIVGEAEGVKMSGGVLDIPTHSLRVRCLPGDLPAQLDADVSALGIGGHFRVSDLKIDADKVQVLADPDTVIATVVPPRTEEEPTAGTTAEPEVVKKGKTDKE